MTPGDVNALVAELERRDEIEKELLSRIRGMEDGELPTIEQMKVMVAKERERLLKLSSDETTIDWSAECVLELYCGRFIRWRNNPTLGGPKWPTCPGNPAMPHRCAGCQLKKQYDEHPEDYEPSVTA